MKADIHPKYIECKVSCACGATFTTKTRGTGLGLAICRKLLVAMGGGVALLDTSAEHPALAGAARKGAAFEVELAPVS